jgi:hypothetical protein
VLAAVFEDVEDTLALFRRLDAADVALLLVVRPEASPDAEIPVFNHDSCPPFKAVVVLTRNAKDVNVCRL